jgi:hypothetical protein
MVFPTTTDVGEAGRGWGNRSMKEVEVEAAVRGEQYVYV